MSDAPNHGPDRDIRSERPQESGDPWSRLPSMAPATPSPPPAGRPVARAAAPALPGRGRTLVDPATAG
ncbi:cytochrome P450, partial [Streptomyces sp. NPDC004285]